MSAWTLEFLGDNLDSYAQVEDPGMRFYINDPYLYGYWFYESSVYTDVSLSASVINQGSDDNFVTLVCRENEQGWYEFNISGIGNYEIYYYQPDSGEFLPLDNGTSDLINSGAESNEFQAVCQGNQLSLYINQSHVSTVTDNQFTEGRIGFAGGSLEDLPVDLVFDWLVVETP